MIKVIAYVFSSSFGLGLFLGLCSLLFGVGDPLTVFRYTFFITAGIEIVLIVISYFFAMIEGGGWSWKAETKDPQNALKYRVLDAIRKIGSGSCFAHEFEADVLSALQNDGYTEFDLSSRPAKILLTSLGRTTFANLKRNNL